tara:strand:- start:29 stop:1570 length:1542 start_codon:yes stop_codon:yes gene_type:complete
MTGGSGYNSEGWKTIDDQGRKLPMLGGSSDVMCSTNGVTWEEVHPTDAMWIRRAGHWTGWWKGKLLLIGGTSGAGQDLNDIWSLEPQGVVQLDSAVVGLAAAGATALLLLVCFCIWSSYYRRRLRRNMRQELLAELEWKDPQLLAMMESARAELSRNIENDWIVPYSDIVVDREALLGQGSFGCVYQGTYSGCQCAMKEIVVSDYEEIGGFSKQTITREVSILSIVSHPNIIRFFGTSSYFALSNNIIIITEYFPVTLAALIGDGSGKSKVVVDVGRKGQPHRKTILFDRKQRRRVLVQVISAVRYLHARKIVHRDLKCDNVLIDARRGDCIEAKICDFGSAKVVSSHNTRNRKGRSKLSSGSTIGIVGTPMYSPPEVLQGGSMSIQAPFLAVRSDAPIGHEGPDGRESLIDTMAETKEGVNGMSLIFGWDIFSFGVLMYCVTHDCLLPYTSVIMENEEMFNGAILDGARPEVDLNKVTTTEKVLMEFCWSADHNQRPHASKIVRALKEESAE